jgi:hypothetical protein
MRADGVLLEECPATGERPGCIDSKEVWMTWQMATAANAAIGVACLGTMPPPEANRYDGP